MDFDVIAYALFGLSLSVSAAQVGSWLLTAHPRTILQAGRISAVCLAVGTPLVLLWLALTGRSTLAMMLAAFAMPVVIESARRWPGLFGVSSLFRRRARKLDDAAIDPIPPKRRAPARDGISPDFAAHCALMLQLYLEQTKQESDPRLGTRLIGSRLDADRLARMSVEEARDVLGVPATAGADDIRSACARLSEKLAPEKGGTRYLAAKISEAADVLLGKSSPPPTQTALTHAEANDLGGSARV